MIKKGVKLSKRLGNKQLTPEILKAYYRQKIR